MRTERTPEERKLFYGERLGILNALTEIQDYDHETDENRRAMVALIETLSDCDNLVNICGHLAGLAVRHGKIRMGPEKEAPERSVTLRDTRILGAGLRGLSKEIETNAPKTSEGKPEQTPEVIRVRRALSRINPVQLFWSAIHGGAFRYWVKQEAKNGIPVSIQRERCFGGIPEEKLPIKYVDVQRGNVTEKIGRPDLGIYPKNAKNIYEILQQLEKDQPTIELKGKPGDKIVSRVVSRNGEAEFFLQHLPRGLKPWAEAIN